MYLFLIISNNNNEINILQDIFRKNSFHNFTHELNKNNKLFFLDVLIDTNNNNNKLTTSTYKKKTSNNNSYTLNFKSECPFRYKKEIINNLISPVGWSCRIHRLHRCKGIRYLQRGHLLAVGSDP